MSKVLIGVGGSGQHVAHAYLRMLALTRCRAQDVPHVYVIDADAKIGGSPVGAVSLTTEIKRLHTQLVSSLPPEARPHFALVKPYFQTDSESQPGRAETAFELSVCPAYLRDAFLTDDADMSGRHAEASDRSVDLAQGMMANAKIGAVAFGLKIMLSGENEELKTVNFGNSDANERKRHSLLRDVNGARVAIVGSSFGGTGSGVIPALVRYLSNVSGGAPLSVRAFMTLPWFEIEAGGASAAATRSDGIDPKLRNSALGLRTYLKELDEGIARSNYVVAQFMGSNAKRPDRGNNNQGEDPHVFNIVLATSIQQFLWDGGDAGAVPGDSVKRKLFGMVSSRPEEIQGRFDAVHSAHLRFRMGKNENLQLIDIVKEAEVLALALAEGAEYIAPGERQFRVRGSDSRPEPDALRELCKAIATNYEKKPLAKRGIFVKTEVAPDEVYSKLADALRACADTIRRSLVWLDLHKATEVVPQGIVWPRFDHLFDQHEEATGVVTIMPLGEESLKLRWREYGLKIGSKQNRGQELGDGTPRISQAFALFLNAFFAKTNFLVELQSLVANQPESPVYQVAADMLVAAVSREVAEARQASRTVEFANDLKDNAPPRQLGQVFIRNLRIDARPENSRLCVIDKAMLDSALGDRDRADFQSPLQDSHPLSLRQIDPYLGAARNASDDISAVYALAQGELVFSETALKGIPNVLAPKLLQQWRLERRGFAVEQDLLEQKPGVRMLKSTETGLYQHACRVIEAAFWLLYTDDHRFELRDEDRDQKLADSLKVSAFARLVNAELKLVSSRVKRNLLPQFVIASRGTDRQPGKVIFVNDPDCAWYLAANSTAREQFAKIMSELPSVKYGQSTLDRAWRDGRSDSHLMRPDKGTYEANMITGFHAFLKRTVEAYFNSGLLWANALVDICARLEPLVDTTAPHLSMGTAASVELATDREGGVQAFAVSRPSALGNMKDLFVKDPVYFFVGDESRSEERWAGLWPIKGSAWEHVVAPDSDDPPNPMSTKLTRRSDPQTSDRSIWEILSIRLNIKGLGLYEFRQPFGGPKVEIPGSSEKIDGLPWAAAVWPNFEAPDWKNYVAGGYWRDGKIVLEDFDLRGASFPVSDWALVFYGDIFSGEGTGSFGEIGRVEMRMPAKLRGVPRSVELVVNGRIFGSMPIRLGHLPESTQIAKVDLAIDFGTSNTCMAIKPDGKLTPQHLALLPGEPLPGDSGSTLPDFTKLVGPAKSPGSTKSIAEQQFREPQSPLFFFQSFNESDKAHKPRSVPSELINLKSDMEGVGAYLESRAKHFEQAFAISSELTKKPSTIRQAMVAPHFTPFPPNPGGLLNLNDLATFLGGGLYRDFKWSAFGDDESDNIGFRAVYLEQLLVAGCATLRWANIRSIKRLVATYPGAFTDAHRDKYSHDLSLIVESVLDSTGITLGVKGPILRSETIAALASSNPGGSRMMVTIDMGGGTTDFGFIVPGMRNQSNSFFSYMSSIQYAGNHLLEALQHSPKLPAYGKKASERLDRLKIMIRTGHSGLTNPAFAKVANAFFEGLFEYVFSVIAAISRSENFPHNKGIDVYLFGNGFKLTDVFLETKAYDFFDRVMVQATEVGLISKEVAANINLRRTDRDTKLDLIQGALKGSIDQSDDESDADRLLKAAEKSGHSRVPIWLPCVTRDGVATPEIHLGTLAERDRMRSDRVFQSSFSVDVENLEGLKRSFPITSRYWGETDAVPAIFNNAPRIGMMSLGQYYLMGKAGVASSYAQVILPLLAAGDSSAPRDTPY